MRGNIPPTAVLRSFIDVVETGSVTRSAERLHLTQSAVSHHLAQFERFVGARLFERGERAIRPTAPAIELAAALARQLGALASTLKDAQRSGRRRRVRIAAAPELLAHWLAVRLPLLAGIHPQIELTALPDRRRDVLSTGEADLHIRLGRPSAAERGFTLAEDEEIAVCSPVLAAILPPREAFRAAPFLVAARGLQTDLGWERWLGEIHGASERWTEEAHPAGYRQLASFDALLEACRQGEGFALVRTLLVKDDLEAGRLVAPFEERLRSELNYVVLWLKEPAPDATVLLVAEWLRREAYGEPSA